MERLIPRLFSKKWRLPFKNDFSRNFLSYQFVTQRKVQILNADIHIELVGSGHHPLLCLSGAIGNSTSDFGPLLPIFSKSELTVVAWDPPGLGKSRPPERDFSGGKDYYYRDAHSAHELMQTLGFQKFSMIGWSDGAKTATIIAAIYPESVIKLITLSANAFITEEDLLCYKRVARIEKWSKMFKKTYGKIYAKQYLQQMWNQWIEMNSELYKSGGDIYTQELSKVRCPTLIVHGDQDPIVPFHHAEFLHSRIENSWLYSVPRGKHNAHLKYPKQFVAFAEHFLLREHTE